MPKVKHSPPLSKSQIENNKPTPQQATDSPSDQSKTKPSKSTGDATVRVTTRNKRQRPSDDSPPTSSLSNQISLDQIGDLIDLKLSPSSSFMIHLRETLMADLKSMISSGIGAAIREVKDEFTATTDFMCEELKDASQKIVDSEQKIKSLEADKSELQMELQRLNGRLTTIEKISRDLNVEIQAVPENRNENVITLFKTLCQSIDTPISENDIKACRRVAKFNAKSPNPRNILVTLSSPRQRDTILSAVHRYNKEHPKNQLNATHIGLTDATIDIYVREHLSPQTKQLHAAARHFKKENKYKFVWVRNGQVYLRKADDTEHIHVKNLDVLKSLQ